jgi:flagellin
MAAVLGTNMASVWASKNLQTAQSNMANTVERLSSGLRINRARDDAAGLSIANSLTQQINGANQGIRNINDGISMVQTAEGAIAAASEMAQRILTLSTQGSNSNLSSDQRIVIGNEVKSLWDSIGKIESRTQFSGVSLINATANITIQSSSVSSDTFTISSGSALENIHLSASGSVAGDVQNMVVLIPTTDTATATSGFTALAGVVDNYITYLDKQRSTLGAIQNQMEFAVDNITELSANLTAARSRIQDTDYASETASLTKGQILQQAATAMLAQANQMPNVILSLLK